MSEMIKCDKCGKLMYTDSRSDKGAYAYISMDYTEGHTSIHLCKACYRQFQVEFVRTYTTEEFDEYFGKVCE